MSAHGSKQPCGDAITDTPLERAIELADQADVTLKMVNLPDGKDPDELIKIDPTLWVTAVSSPQYVVDWLMDRYQAKADITTAIAM